ncbi:very-long-chain enoyl-CoA reductase, partial [Elysia marginata]
MSTAFDTITIDELLEILEPIIHEDKTRMMRFLMSNIAINTKIDRTARQKPFTGNAGRPRGDSLSHVLFPIYFENVFKEKLHILPQSTDGRERICPDEIAYPDQ